MAERRSQGRLYCRFSGRAVHSFFPLALCSYVLMTCLYCLHSEALTYIAHGIYGVLFPSQEFASFCSWCLTVSPVVYDMNLTHFGEPYSPPPHSMLCFSDDFNFFFLSLSSAELHWSVSFRLCAEWMVIAHPVGAVDFLGRRSHPFILSYTQGCAEWMAVKVIGHFLWNAWFGVQTGGF